MAISVKHVTQKGKKVSKNEACSVSSPNFFIWMKIDPETGSKSNFERGEKNFVFDYKRAENNEPRLVLSI